MTDKQLRCLGYVAASMTTLMFGSYLDQIRLNLSGVKGSPYLPLLTVISTLLWMAYALLRERKDWPIAICNGVGLVLGVVTFLTSL